MVDENAFLEDIDNLRASGAKKVFLKTGAYRPYIALTMKLASEAKIDALTFDGQAENRHVSCSDDERGFNANSVEAQVLKCAQILKKKGKHVPDIVMAGCFINETQIFKSIAMSGFEGKPFVKAIAMGRAPLTAVMKAKHYVELAKNDNLPKGFAANLTQPAGTVLRSDNRAC